MSWFSAISSLLPYFSVGAMVPGSASLVAFTSNFEGISNTTTIVDQYQDIEP